MTFALAMTLVVLISSVVLLYQFWAGSLVSEDEPAGSGRIDAFPERPSAPPRRIDSAA